MNRRDLIKSLIAGCGWLLSAVGMKPAKAEPQPWPADAKVDGTLTAFWDEKAKRYRIGARQQVCGVASVGDCTYPIYGDMIVFESCER